MVQAAFFDRVSFDPFAFEQDGLSASKVDVGGSEIVEALMVTAMIVMLDEGRDLGFKVLLEEVVFKQDAVLQRLVPAFDFPLRLRVAGSAVNLVDLVFLQPFAEIRCDVTRTDSRRGRCSTLTLSQPEAANARSSVSVTSSTFMLVHSFQAMM